ncbi:hypothetical protein Ancab_009767 [Ancistrocladus abbreviatus]
MIQSPGGLVTLTSLSVNANSLTGPANIFAIGAYAHETQLVSPPVFSAFTTEPSTAAVIPPEPAQMTTPPSPEVPFAWLLTSSLSRTSRNCGSKQKHALSYYESHQLNSGSPSSHLISPGSANSASGTSSPHPVRLPRLEFCMEDASKLFDTEKFTTCKWGSGLGYGSLTPNVVGLASQDSLPQENQNSEVASPRNEIAQELQAESDKEEGNGIYKKVGGCCEFYVGEASDQILLPDSWEAKDCKHKHSSISLGSVKEFSFDSLEVQLPGKSTIGSNWWADGEDGKNMETQNNWTFFPLLQPGVS